MFTQTYLNSEMSSVQFTQSCLTLCNPMDCRISGFPVHYQLPEPTQTHVHHVGDAIQPSHPLWSNSPSAFSLSSGSFQKSQFFTSGGQSIVVSASTSVLSMNIPLAPGWKWDWCPPWVTGALEHHAACPLSRIHSLLHCR